MVGPHRQIDNTLGFDLRFHYLVALSSIRTLSLSRVSIDLTQCAFRTTLATNRVLGSVVDSSL